MALSVSIDIRDNATALLKGLEKKIAPAAVAKVAGRAGVNYLRRNFLHLNATRANKMGGKRTNFYAQAARGTTFTSDNSGATLSVNQVGIRQRIEGGVVLPKKAGGLLTIPARAEAYGRRASEFNNLKVQYGKGGRPVALVIADATEVKKTKKGFRAGKEIGGGVMFWLVPKVVQEPDPTILKMDALRTAVLADLAIYIKAIDARNKSQAPPMQQGGAA